MRRIGTSFVVGSIAILIFVALISPRELWSQQSGGRISGQVTDPSGAAIPDALVEARHIATNVSTTAKSNTSGYYTIQLPVGVYEIRVSHSGFSTSALNVTVTVGSDVGLNVAMVIASQTTTVNVTESVVALIQPDEASGSTTVESALVANMPVEVSGGMRNSADFLRITPGYQGTSFSARLNGGVGLDQEVMVDGVNVSPVGFGTGIQGAQMTVPSFAVQEFQVVGTNIDAQYGRTSSGAIKYAFKSGTNDFHGSAFEYLKNTDLDARNYFAPTRGLDRQN
jgi:hypothetical protein